MNDFHWQNAEAIFNSIKKESRERRAAPIKFFQKFLMDIWMNNTPEESTQQWRVKVEQFPWYADDALYCMDFVISNPPNNLVELMKNSGWIILYHEPDEAGYEKEYSFEEYLDWLKKIRNEFYEIYKLASSENPEDG